MGDLRKVEATGTEEKTLRVSRRYVERHIGAKAERGTRKGRSFFRNSVTGRVWEARKAKGASGPEVE